VEGELLSALCRAGLLAPSNAQSSKCGLHRCSRTDRGVSAAANVFSVKLELPSKEFNRDPTACLSNANMRLNACLPSDMRSIAMRKTSYSFDPRKGASFRRYVYIIPKSALREMVGYHDIHRPSEADARPESSGADENDDDEDVVSTVIRSASHSSSRLQQRLGSLDNDLSPIAREIQSHVNLLLGIQRWRNFTKPIEHERKTREERRMQKMELKWQREKEQEQGQREEQEQVQGLGHESDPKSRDNATTQDDPVASETRKDQDNNFYQQPEKANGDDVVNGEQNQHAAQDHHLASGTSAPATATPSSTPAPLSSTSASASPVSLVSLGSASPSSGHPLPFHSSDLQEIQSVRLREEDDFLRRHRSISQYWRELLRCDVVATNVPVEIVDLEEEADVDDVHAPKKTIIEPCLMFELEGRSFLYHQIRHIVGGAVASWHAEQELKLLKETEGATSSDTSSNSSTSPSPSPVPSSVSPVPLLTLSLRGPWSLLTPLAPAAGLVLLYHPHQFNVLQSGFRASKLKPKQDILTLPDRALSADGTSNTSMNSNHASQPSSSIDSGSSTSSSSSSDLSFISSPDPSDAALQHQKNVHGDAHSDAQQHQQQARSSLFDLSPEESEELRQFFQQRILPSTVRMIRRGIERMPRDERFMATNENGTSTSDAASATVRQSSSAASAPLSSSTSSPTSTKSETSIPSLRSRSLFLFDLFRFLRHSFLWRWSLSQTHLNYLSDRYTQRIEQESNWATSKWEHEEKEKKENMKRLMKQMKTSERGRGSAQRSRGGGYRDRRSRDGFYN